jgi:DNA primase
MVTPNEEGRNSNRVIIPFTFNNKIVGSTSRYLDNRTPKFISDQQSGYIFGYDFQKPEWECCIVVEGIFDALSINGCALTTNTIGETQADLLRNLNKTIIVVPDQDKTGLAICDQALEVGFQVSLPDWGPDVKDVNDAVIKYGRLPTLLSILRSATNSKIKIQIARTKLDKRI